ncbi:hypothetical protein PROFUN_03794 [Planoprotostelium fungivorum]|uniref:Uncharacterized protein n=1 Tax=Planoprotostelium fungivorum TaxID=1890364 RepID=A0A2P6NI77_9EUKA|nr:hypothetical protein PROFUN_03794 [Planoprotostelium fungivorum]
MRFQTSDEMKEHVTRSPRIHGSTEFVAEGLDRQDSIIETKGRDRQPLNKTRTPRHWDRDRGKDQQSLNKTQTPHHWGQDKWEMTSDLNAGHGNDQDWVSFADSIRFLSTTSH